MIVHPNHVADPKFFLSGLEVLLRRYSVEIHAGAIVTPNGPVAVMGFIGPSWMLGAKANQITHRTARQLSEQESKSQEQERAIIVQREGR